MKKKSKLFLSFIVILIVLAIAIIGGNIFIENKMETALEENLKKAEFKYEDLNASLLGRSASISNPVYNKNGMQINAEEIKIDGIDILEYINNKNIEINTLKFTKPEVTIYTEAEKEKDTSEKGNSAEIDLLIKSVEVVDGNFKMAKNDSVKKQLFANIPSLNLKQVSVNRESLKSALPFNYEDLEMISDSLFFNLNDLHDMYVEKMEMNENSLIFSNIEMKPLYDKQEFQKHIPYEKDRFNLILGELTLESFNWSFKNDSLSLESSATAITNGDIKIYRDKQVKDDPRQKPM
uniref:hypothetical protein n=1 Tax=uncultured Salegentibacter sp. TaxID=259320 RepID=UPI0030D9B1C5